jgi:phospholipase C
VIPRPGNHIVVLMLENRSFDCLLGKLYDRSAGFDGLSGSEQNPDNSGGSGAGLE